MKKKWSLLLMMVLPVMIMAQNPMDKLYEKYAGQEGFTSVNISPEMFSMFAEMNIDTTKIEGDEAKEAVDMISQMNGMKILTYKKESANDNEFYNEIKDAFDFNAYKELMSVKEEGTDVKFYVKRKGEMISEMLMIAEQADETVLMNFSGLFNMRTVAKLGQSMNMHGMEHLEELDKK
jgi:hypothetical protein